MCINIDAPVPRPLYTKLIGISKAKYMDLQVLKKFCGAPSQNFYSNLPIEFNNDEEESE